MFHYLQYGRMRFSVEGAYLVVAPVRGERVLGQIVRTDAEKIDEGSEPFRDEGGSRRFDHDTDLHVFAVGNAPGVQIAFYFRNDRANPPHFLFFRDHRKHDVQFSFRA